MIAGIKKEDYYLTRGLKQKQIDLLDGYALCSDEDKVGLRDIITKFAEARNREAKNIQLRKAQIDPVVMSYINPRFFIGDEPGLGKTVMSAASFAYYGFMQMQENKEVGKCIVVTESSHIVKFAKEWQSYGINMIPVFGGAVKMTRQLAEFDMEEHDGIVLGWDGMRTNGFLDFYLENHKQFKFIVCDETSKLLNPKSMIYQITDSLINTYQGGIERALFLNGTSFEKSIYDFYYQFNVLQPKLIPSKKFLDDRYVVKEMDAVYRRDKSGKAVRQRFAQIVDYKNQAELKERLQYFYVARMKADYSSDLPEHSYNLHVIHMTPEQEQKVAQEKRITLINSPKTSNPDEELTVDNSPKLKALLEYYETVKLDRPIIYVYNKESQYTITELLNNKGVKTELLNGDEAMDTRAEIIDRFNNYETDCLVFNIEKALNIPTSDRILFYDIPTMPSRTGQIKARIDRNNYTTEKHYDFFCYYLSPEWSSMSRLGHFREYHAGEFTGQQDTVYQSLVDQMNEYIPEDVQTQVTQQYAKLTNPKIEFKDIEPVLNKLLGIVGG